MAAQLQPVHKGHFDVGEHHVGVELLRQLQGLLPVARLPHQDKPQAGPVDLTADAHPDLLLVVGQQNPVFLHMEAPLPAGTAPALCCIMGKAHYTILFLI